MIEPLLLPWAQAAPPDFEIPVPSLQWIAIAVVASVLVFAVWKALSSGRKKKPARKGVQHVDLAALGDNGPDPEATPLECYHVPVRLALVVLAPLGRDTQLNVEQGLPHLLDQIVHGLDQVVETHQPLIRLWEPQLSKNGFTTAFFANASLPGQKGKGTPWCALAGRCEVNGRNLMVGMVLRAEKANNLGQILMEQEYAWPDVLRPRPS